MYHSFIKVDQGHHVPDIYLFGMYSKACMKQRFMTSTTCENTWCKLVLTLTAMSSMLARPSEIMCACCWWKKKEQTTGWKYIWSALLNTATINKLAPFLWPTMYMQKTAQECTFWLSLSVTPVQCVKQRPTNFILNLNEDICVVPRITLPQSFEK